MTIAGVDLFVGATWVGIAVLAVVFFGSYFVKGTIGIGALSPAILFGTMVVGPHHAVLLAVITNAVSHLQFLPQGLRDGDWRVARQVILGNFAGSALGVWIFGQVSGAWLTLLLGLTLGGVLIAEMTEALERLSAKIDLRAPSFVIPLSATSGLISGVTGGGGFFFIAIYVKHVCPIPSSYRGTVILLAMLVVVWRTMVLVYAGFIDLTLVFEGALMLPAIVIGGIVGTWCYRTLSVRGFFRFFQAVVLFGAVNLVWKGLRDLL